MKLNIPITLSTLLLLVLASKEVEVSTSLQHRVRLERKQAVVLITYYKHLFTTINIFVSGKKAGACFERKPRTLS